MDKSTLKNDRLVLRMLEMSLKTTLFSDIAVAHSHELKLVQTDSWPAIT